MSVHVTDTLHTLNERHIGNMTRVVVKKKKTRDPGQHYHLEMNAPPRKCAALKSTTFKYANRSV